SDFLYSWKAGDDTTGFTRSGAVAYFDAAGVLKLAPENTPRIALDPLGGSGLLLEPAQAFGWSYTGDFNQSGVWSKSFLTVANTSVLGPDRTTTVQKLVPAT